MILETDYPQYRKEAQEIDKDRYYVNLIIKRITKDQPPHCEKGIIRIPDREDKDLFTFNLTHESGHLTIDPLTFPNWIEGINKIKQTLKVQTDQARTLANITSDLMIEYETSKIESLARYMSEGIKKIQPKAPSTPWMEALRSIYKHLYENKTSEKYRDLIDKVTETLSDPTLMRLDKYIKVASLFLPYFEQPQTQDQNQGDDGEAQSQDQNQSDQSRKGKKAKEEQEAEDGEDNKEDLQPYGENPFQPSDEEIEEEVKKALRDSADVEESKNRLETLRNVSSKGIGKGEGLLKNPEALTIAFYEAKARSAILSIDFPTVATRKGVQIGSAKWTLRDGVKAMNLKRTIHKSGINIPTVTTRKDRIIKKFVGDSISTKPCDLIVSIDCSDSTGYLTGSLISPADYEITLLCAILNLAKRIDQRVGLHLWDTQTKIKIDPTDWKRFHELKQFMLSGLGQGDGTTISVALQDAQQNPDKVYFIVTDGIVFPKELLAHKASNVIFLLVPTDSFYGNREYVRKTFEQGEIPKEQIIEIENLKKIPHVGLKAWKDRFWRR